MKSNFVYQRFNRSPPVGHFYFSLLVRKIPFVGIELKSQRVRAVARYLGATGGDIAFSLSVDFGAYIYYFYIKQSIYTAQTTDYAVSRTAVLV